MPNMDSAAKAAVSGTSFAAAWYIFLDISGDPLRVTTFGADATFSGTGDSDLDGNTFTAFVAKMVDVGDVTYSDSGSDTVTVTLSGINGLDTSLLDDIGNKALWQGQLARLWFQPYDETGTTAQGAIVPFYTGYMSKVSVVAEPKSQKIQLSIENYLSYTTQASNCSYLNQADYDPADTSAAASIAAANGARPGTSVGSGTGGGGYGGAGLSSYRGLVHLA